MTMLELLKMYVPPLYVVEPSDGGGGDVRVELTLTVASSPQRGPLIIIRRGYAAAAKDVVRHVPLVRGKKDSYRVGIRVGCHHGGESYKDGSDVAMVDPCVKCRCVRGVLVCRLRVCNPQPHPPPPGCLVLTRRSECCQRLVCNQGENSNAPSPFAVERS
ncbi:hypothetical protein J6590_033289 [Homalodisca vitripennis]|nr:hypothetical protein J6590_033289 [Homalodisca vitripennis]